MARAFGVIASRIWSDHNFLALDAEAQRLYLFLLSQPDLSHAGLVPLRARRWSKKVAKTSPGEIVFGLERLSHARFILMDEDTEEVIIRTFVRNDGVYKQPKVMLRMREDARLIESPTLRAAFAIELRRLPLTELGTVKTGPNRDQPSTREVVTEVVESLLADFAVHTLPDTHSEGYAIPPTYAQARSPFPHNPSPTTLPPQPKDEKHSSAVADAPADKEIVAPRHDVDELLDYLDAGIRSNDAKTPGRTKGNTTAMRLLIDKDGRNVEQIKAAIDFATNDEFWRSNILSASTLRKQYDRLRMKAQDQKWKRPGTGRSEFWQDTMAQARDIDARNNPSNALEIEAS